MKKIYNSPVIETVEMYLSSMICDISNGDVQQTPGFDPFNPAPRRRVF